MIKYMLFFLSITSGILSCKTTFHKEESGAQLKIVMPNSIKTDEDYEWSLYFLDNNSNSQSREGIRNGYIFIIEKAELNKSRLS